MTLRARLLLTTCVLSLAITIGLSLLVRRAWEQTERERFDESFRRAVSEVQSELRGQSVDLERRLGSLCAHDTAVDSALLGLENGTLASRLLPIRLGLQEQRKALGLAELALVSDAGAVLVGTVRGEGAQVEPELLEHLAGSGSGSSVRRTPSLALEAFCKKPGEEAWVALLGTKPLSPMLDAAAAHQDLTLSIAGPHRGATSNTPEAWSMAIVLEQADGLELVAHRSRLRLSRALSQVDLTLVSAALAMLALALGVAILLSSGLSRPVVQFAERTRAAVRDQPEPLPVEGGPELRQAARAFNQTLLDLSRLKERLKVTERIFARRDLARQVAHEIKNPLMPIFTSVETLRKLRASHSPAFEEVVDEALATILSEVRRMTKLVENFSAYGRLPEPHPTRFDLLELVERIAQLHRDLGPTISVEREEGFGDTTVVADRDQLTQAVTNLLKNAIEALEGVPAGIVNIRVGAPGDGDQGLVAIDVWDNGAGVPPELVPSLFEPYRTTKALGSGLGLAIAHRIAVEHGGDLAYREQDGACFTLSLRRDGPPRIG